MNNSRINSRFLLFTTRFLFLHFIFHARAHLIILFLNSKSNYNMLYTTIQPIAYRINCSLQIIAFIYIFLIYFRYFCAIYLILMSEKNKRSKNKQQTLSNFVKNEGCGQNISIKESLQRQIQKLQKIRKDIQRKRLQQNKIISNILRLQLSEQPEVQMKEQIHENEEYWIFTDQKSIDHSRFSMFKLILGDYGRTQTNPSYVPLKSITQQHVYNIQNTSTKEAGQRYVYQQQAITKINLCSQTQLQMKQWHQNGCIKSEYLYDYQNDFIHYLQSMQYIATQLATSTKNGHL